MQDWTARLSAALTAQGLIVRDVRDVLPRHPTRTYAQRDPDRLRGVVWHQALSYGYGLHTVEAIARYHASARSHLSAGGAPGFAYTLAVDADGTVYVCQPVELATWSHGQPMIPDANHALIGVCALGRYSYTDALGVLQASDEPPPPQEAALVRVWRAAQSVWGWAVDAPSGGLLDHETLGKPSCPGDRLSATQDALRAGQRVPALRVPPTGRPRVVWVQACLSALGCDLGPAGVDGDEGEATRAALRAFQVASSLTPDGRCGPRTEAALLVRMRALYPPDVVPG